MTPRQKTLMLVVAGIFCTVALIALVGPMIFLPIGGPDNVPREVQTQRFLNSGDVVFDNGTERAAFRLKGSVMNGKPPIFPDLSPFTSSAIHTREGSDDLYLTIVWHFTDAVSFTRNRERLKMFYLEREGRSFPEDLILEYGDNSRNSGSPARDSVLNVTGFESNITAGYFTVVGAPGDKSADYFIIYFGTIKSGPLNRQAPYLRLLMGPVFDPVNFDRPTFSL